MSDAVNHPAHYNQGSVEAIDVMEAWFPGEPHLFTALKYVLRAPYKGAAKQDYAKAAWYVRRRMDRLHAGETVDNFCLGCGVSPKIEADDPRLPVLVALSWATTFPDLEKVADLLEALARE
jgi:hypothetical protein